MNDTDVGVFICIHCMSFIFYMHLSLMLWLIINSILRTIYLTRMTVKLSLCSTLFIICLNFLYELCMHVCGYVHVHMDVFMCIGRCNACVCVCGICKGQRSLLVTIECLPLSLFSTLFETGSHQIWSLSVWPDCLANALAGVWLSASPALGLYMCTTIPSFSVNTGHPAELSPNPSKYLLEQTLHVFVLEDKF